MYSVMHVIRIGEVSSSTTENLTCQSVVMSIKFGAKPIEFEKGKAGIVVPSKDKLPAVIDTLISAVRAGELDELFNQAAKTGSIGKARKAA